MRKYIFLAALLVSVLGLSATAGYALEPSCNPKIWQAMANRAEAVRARNRAYEMEVISRNDSTLWLTCFDQEVRLSARLGYIFSDRVTPDPPIANTIVFTPDLAYPGWGTQRILARELHWVISPLFVPYMFSNFTAFFGRKPPVENAMADFAAELAPIFADIDKFHTAEKPDLEKAHDLYKKIYDLIRDLPTSTTPDDDVEQIRMAVDELVTLKDDVESNRLSKMKPLLDKLKDEVMGGKTSMTRACVDRMKDLWEKGNPAAEFMPVEGAYIAGSPYYPLNTILNPATRPGGDNTFARELRVNAGILKAAWDDLADGGVLNAGSTLRPEVPPAAQLTSTDAIIRAMAGP